MNDTKVLKKQLRKELDEVRFKRTNEKYCEKCGKFTVHDRAKYLHRWYNRCLTCLEKELKENNVYFPPFVRTGRINRDKWLRGLRFG